MATLAELRARVNNAQKTSNNFDNSTIFQFSSLKAGDEIRIRFIPDADATNDWFWRIRSTRKIPFNSIRLANGTIVNNRCRVSVPAFNLKKGDTNIDNLSDEYLYLSSDDVIQNKIKGFWGETKESKDLYYRYAKKDTYVYQGFIRTPGYETKLYRFLINKQLHEKIYSFMNDSEIDCIPSDPNHGRDFILRVSEKSAPIDGVTTIIKDYNNSKWSNNESPLTEQEVAWLSENNPWVLSNFISKRPSVEQEEVMIELFEASYNDQPYDVERWLNIFKPDNIHFDEMGNIVDKKDGNKTMTEIPAVQPFINPNGQFEQVAESVQVPYQSAPMGVDPRVYQNTGMGNITVASNTNPQQYVYAAQPQMSTAQPVVQPTVQPVAQPTAPQLIQQNTVPVSGSTPNAVINDILSKFNIGQH